MGQKKIIILVVVLVIFGLAMIGYFKAVPGAENYTGQEPQIKITPQEYDFGQVKYGQVLKYAFKIKNIGQKPLKILKTATSCGCTSAKVKKNQLMPQEEMSLNVEYKTSAMSGSHAKGAQERIIYVKTNDPINPQAEVIIKAYVK